MTHGMATKDVASGARRARRLAAVGIVLVGCGVLVWVTAGTASAASAPAAAASAAWPNRAADVTPSPMPYPGMMMGSPGWMDADGGWHHRAMTRSQARAAARDWVARHHPGASTSGGVKVRHGFRFNIARHGGWMGTLTVNSQTGNYLWARQQ